MPSEPTNHAPKATIKFKTITQEVKLRCVTIPPGGVVPRYRVEVGYVVFTLSAGVATVRKTTYRNDEQHVEILRLDPAAPFYVPAFPPGVEVSMENIGPEVVVFGKMPTDPGEWNWC